MNWAENCENGRKLALELIAECREDDNYPKLINKIRELSADDRRRTGFLNGGCRHGCAVKSSSNFKF